MLDGLRERWKGRRLARAESAALTRGRVYGDLTDELPEEDLTEDLREGLDLYLTGTKPTAEEVEYLEALEAAIDRLDEFDLERRSA